VPVASSRLALDDEETKAYDTRSKPGVSLSTLLAKCQGPGAPVSEVASAVSTTIEKVPPRGASFHTVPHFPEDPTPHVAAESNLHQMENERIEDALAQENAPDAAPDMWIKAWSSHPAANVASAQSIPARPSGRRSILARLLFATIAIATGLLAAWELSATGHLPRLDPRPLLSKGVKLAKERIPWDRLPKMPTR
jgi:hypothetical protein